MRRKFAGRTLAQAVAGAVAIAAVAAPAASAAGAFHVYPTGAPSTFTSGLDGWTGAASANAPATATAVHDPSIGNDAPPGSVRARLSPLVLPANGTMTFTSAEFVASSPAPARAALAFIVRLHKDALVLTGSTTVSATLYDLTNATNTQLFSQNVPAFVAPFVDTWIPVPGAVPVAKMVPGHHFKLELKAASSATGVGNLDVNFDYVALATQDPDPVTPPGGGGGGGTGGLPGTSGGASGGIVIAPPKSSAAMDALQSEINVNAESGNPALLGTSVPAAQCTIIGIPGKADTIKGTAGNDVICGLDGNDTLDGGGGNDILDGGAGNDRLLGGSGKDSLLGLLGNDRLNGGASADRLGGGSGTDVISGLAGNDRLGGGSGKDKLDGGSGNDLADAGSGADRVSGGSGKDLIGGGAGNDTISARDKTRDRVDGGSGKDTATTDRIRKGEKKTKAKLRRTDLVLRVEKVR